MADNIKGKPVKTTLVGTEAFPIDDTGNDRHALLSAVRSYVLGTLSTDDISVLNDGVVTHLGNLTEHLSHHASPYIASGGVVTDNGDGTINITAGEVWIKIDNAIDADFEAFAVAADDIAITANQNIIVYVDYNAGSPIYTVMQSVAGYFYSNWDTVPFATVVNTGSKIIINDFKDTATNGIYKNILSQINYQPFRYLGGLSASDGGTRNPVITAGALLFSNDYLAIAGLDTTGSGTFTRMYVTAGTWTRTASQTTIDNTQYNNTTTGMVNISNNKFAKKYLYFIKDTPSFWVVLEGQAEYDTLSEAQDAGVPSTLPPELSAFYAGSILVAAFIVKQGQSAFQDIQNPFVTPFTSSAASLHDNLGGLNLAGNGITYGHITADAQTIYGPKIFNNNLVVGESGLSAGGTIYTGVYSSATDSDPRIGIKNDARLFVLRVDGGDSDKFKIRDGSVSQDRFVIDGDGKISIIATPSTDANATKYVSTRDSSTGEIKQIAYNTTTSEASSATPTPTGASKENEYYLTALAAGATFAAPSGTPANGNNLIIRIKDNGTARSLAYNAIYRAVGVTLPTTTVISKTLYLGCIYNSTDSKWDVVSVVQEA